MKAEVSIEGIGARAERALALDVNAFDPLSGGITFKNNRITSGTYINQGYVFGIYDEESGSISLVSFTADSTTYIWGVYASTPVPAKGSSRTVTRNTYALEPSETTTFDCLVFIGPEVSLGSFEADYGWGTRMIGIKWADLQPYLDTVYDTEIYLDVVTVTPWGSY